MKKTIVSIFLLCLYTQTFAQLGLKKTFPKSAYSAQYAGSVGVFSVGYVRLTPKEKIEIAGIYGHVPQLFGGPLNSFTLKLTYNPIKLNLSERFVLEPIQGGLFITGWFGENQDISWSSRYPHGYYWWQSNMRKHAFVSSQISYKMKKNVDRLSLYFEVNTNDLYIYNIFPNWETISFYEIIFFGMGVKIYMAE